MPDRQSATDSRDQQEAADVGDFASLAAAKQLLLITFERDGTPVSAPVPGVTDSDRTYFGAWSRSGSVKRLQHIGEVQVTPCSMRGFCTYGPPLDAVARLLPGEEASWVAGKLARKHPVRHRFLILLLRRTQRWQMMYYELLADGAIGDDDLAPQGFRAPDQLGDQYGRHAVHGVQGLVLCQFAHTHVTDHGPASIACIWSAPVRMWLPGAVPIGG